MITKLFSEGFDPKFYKQNAIKNFERFHKMKKGSATIDEVKASSEGIDGWSKYYNEIDLGEL